MNKQYIAINKLNLKIKINKQAGQKQTHRYREHSDGCQMEWGLEDGQKR